MRVLFLADTDSPHTLKWAKSLIKTNVEVGIFTLHTPNMDLYSDEPEIVIESLNASRELQSKKETNIGKLIYFKSFHEVRKVIKKFNPDIVHSHYASSYGLVGALSNFHPYLISVWGSDIY
ncbi:MAG: glycosyltransferase, partial [Ignavibacteriaceae bacterium]|nr:glycosyltransferase [Ignavibacteriaceae bacterium]